MKNLKLIGMNWPLQFSKNSFFEVHWELSDNKLSLSILSVLKIGFTVWPADMSLREPILGKFWTGLKMKIESSRQKFSKFIFDNPIWNKINVK